MADEQDMGALVPFTGDGGRLIRRQWHDDRWYFSVVDVVGLLSEAVAARTYWAQLKAKLAAEGADETLRALKQLKMRALDGKLRTTDAADEETLLRIIQSIPSPKAEPVKQWLAGVGAERLQEVADLSALSEDQRRLYARDQLAEHNKSLAAAAADSGVLSTRDFAVFQDHGYMGLYNGERARDIHARKGLARGQHILDHMESEELAANLFRATQAEAKLRREGIQGKDAANQTHFEVGRKVRGYIADLGGTMPEELPTPDESIQQVRAREWRHQIGAEQPQLFAGEDDDGQEE